MCTYLNFSLAHVLNGCCTVIYFGFGFIFTVHLQLKSVASFALAEELNVIPTPPPLKINKL